MFDLTIKMKEYHLIQLHVKLSLWIDSKDFDDLLLFNYLFFWLLSDKQPKNNDNKCQSLGK